MNWTEEEFIRDSEDPRELPPIELTGWEAVRFEIEDDPAPDVSSVRRSDFLRRA